MSDKRSGWKCERCLNAGVVDHDEAADVYTVVHLLTDAHGHASGGKCTDLAKVRAWEVPREVPT